MALTEAFARRICDHARAEGRCAEMLECLFDGGSVTLQDGEGPLVLISALQLSAMWAGQEGEHG